MAGGLLVGTWTGVHASRAYLVDDPDLEIAVNVNLARESHVRREFRLHREAIAFEVHPFARIAVKHLDAASGATRIPATAVKNVDTGIFEGQTSFPAGGSVSTRPVAVSAFRFSLLTSQKYKSI